MEVWGRAAAGEDITVSLAAATVSGRAGAAAGTTVGERKEAAAAITVTARSDASGRWSVMLSAMAAGGPFVLTAQGRSGVTQSVHDVLVGDVFLCSGQSNMELPVQRAGDTDSEIRDSRNDTIRMVTVAHASSAAPQEEFASPVAWQSAAPETVPEWSAACFFFARELQKTVRVPIGPVHASWGGSNIRPWMSAAPLHANGDYESALGLLALHARDSEAAQSQFGREWEEWWRGKSGEVMGKEPWRGVGAAAARGSAPSDRSSAGTAPNDWQLAPAKLGDWRTWGVPELKDFTGLVWYRTHIKLSAAAAKAASRLDLGAINQVDQTWINGRVVGNTFGYGTDRTYNIAPGLLHAGDNLLVINVLCNYGGGGLLEGGAARGLRLADGKTIPLSGTWEYLIAPAAYGYPPRAPWESVGGFTSLYNAMIAPLGHYAFRGALWYQGESNTGEPETYQGLLTGLMADWRRQFGSALPFLIVQLPNYGKRASAPEESGWAEVREAQRQAVARDSHAGLAVTIDIGDAHNLHPTNKQDVGRRLALAARHVIYEESIAPSGPMALSARRADGQVVVDFGDVADHLVAFSHDTPIGFELCGDAPRTCQFAEARIEGKAVLVGRTGTAASRVRYCWADSPICTLFDTAGLPAGPFEIRISGSAAR